MPAGEYINLLLSVCAFVLNSDVRSTAPDNQTKPSKAAAMGKKRQQAMQKSDSVGGIASSAHKLEEDEGEEQTRAEEQETAEEKLDREIVSVVETTLLALQMDSDRLGRKLFKCLFALRPDVKQQFPFLVEKSNTAFPWTYKGVFPRMEPYKWTLLFRSGEVLDLDY